MSYKLLVPFVFYLMVVYHVLRKTVLWLHKKCNLKIEHIFKSNRPAMGAKILSYAAKATAGRKIICSCKNFHQQQDTIFLNTYLQLLENDRLIFFVS